MSNKDKKIEELEKTFNKKDNTKTGWATLILKSQSVPLESFRTKGELSLENAKIGFIMKGYIGGMTEEVFVKLKEYVIENDKMNGKAEMSKEVSDLFEFIDTEFEVVLTDTTKDNK